MAIKQSEKSRLIDLAKKVKRANGQVNPDTIAFYNLYKKFNSQKELNNTNFKQDDLNLILRTWNENGGLWWKIFNSKLYNTATDLFNNPEEVVSDVYIGSFMSEKEAKKIFNEKLAGIEDEKIRNFVAEWAEGQLASGVTYNELLLKAKELQKSLPDTDPKKKGVQDAFSDDSENSEDGFWSFTKKLGEGLVAGAKDFWKELTIDDKKYSSKSSMVDQMTNRLLAPTRNEAISSVREKEIAAGAANVQKLGKMAGIEVDITTARNIASMFGSATADQIRHQLMNLAVNSENPDAAAKMAQLLDKEWDTIFKGSVGSGTALYDTMAKGITNVNTLKSLGEVANYFTQAPTLENGYLNADDALATYRTMEAEGLRLQNFRVRDTARARSEAAFHGAFTDTENLGPVEQSRVLRKGSETGIQVTPLSEKREAQSKSDLGDMSSTVQLTRGTDGRLEYKLTGKNVDTKELLAPQDKEYRNALTYLDETNGWNPFIKEMGVKGMRQAFQAQKQKKLSDLEMKILDAEKNKDTKALAELREQYRAVSKAEDITGLESNEALSEKLNLVGLKQETLTNVQNEWEQAAQDYRLLSKEPGAVMSAWSQTNAMNRAVMEAGDAYVGATPMRQMIEMERSAQQRVINMAKNLAGSEKYFTGDPNADAAAAQQLIRVFGGSDPNGNIETQSKQAAYALQLAESSHLGMERALSAAKVAADSAKAHGRGANEVAGITRMGLELYNQVVNDPFRKARFNPESTLARSMDVAARRRGTNLAKGARWLAGITLNKEEMEKRNPGSYTELQRIQNKIRNGEPLSDKEAELVKDHDKLLAMTGKDPASFTEEAISRLEFDEVMDSNIDAAVAEAQSHLDFAEFGAGNDESVVRDRATRRSGFASQDTAKQIGDTVMLLMQNGVDPVDAEMIVTGKQELSEDQLAEIERQHPGARAQIESALKATQDAIKDTEGDTTQEVLLTQTKSMMRDWVKEVAPEFQESPEEAFRAIQSNRSMAERQKRLAEAKSYFSQNGHGSFMASFLEGDTFGGGLAKAFREQGSAMQWDEAADIIDKQGYAAMLTRFANSDYANGTEFFKSLHGDNADAYVEDYVEALGLKDQAEGKTLEEKKTLVYQALQQKTPAQIAELIDKNANLQQAKTDVDRRLLESMPKKPEGEGTGETPGEQPATENTGGQQPSASGSSGAQPAESGQSEGQPAETSSGQPAENEAAPTSVTTAETTAPSTAVVGSDNKPMVVTIQRIDPEAANEIGRAVNG